MNILILGPQGSGKGTQAALLAEKYDMLHLESGQLLRSVAEINTRVRDIINKGELVPSGLSLELMEEEIEKDHGFEKGIVFDGSPRTLDQYVAMKKWLTGKNQNIDLAVVITINEDETVARLSARRTCEKCGRVYNLITNPPPATGVCECGGVLIQREDDKPEAIKKRLAIYHERTQPMLEGIKKDGILVEVDGARSIEEIQEELVKIVEEKQG